MMTRTSAFPAVLAVASLAWASVAQRAAVQYAPSCRHDAAARPEDRARRAEALTLARAIHAAQADRVRRLEAFQPLERLSNLPPTPDGFDLILYADRSGYIFALKDTTDPCHFAVFSDTRGLLYEQSALAAPVVAQ